MELGGDVIDESDGVGLGMAIEDSQSPNAGRIVNRRVLIALDGIAVFSLEGQELDVDLDLMSGDFLFIAGGMDFPQSCPAREAVDPMTLEDAIHACIGDFDAVIARQIPHDPDRPEMVGLTQMQHLVDDFGCCPIGWILRRGLPIDHPASPCRP